MQNGHVVPYSILGKADKFEKKMIEQMEHQRSLLQQKSVKIDDSLLLHIKDKQGEDYYSRSRHFLPSIQPNNLYAPK